MPDVSHAEKDYAAFKAEVDNVDARLQLIKASDNRRWSQLVELSQELQDAQSLAWGNGNPMARKINQLAIWKTEWLAEKKNWVDWESRLLTEPESPQLKAVFSAAGETIGVALKLIMNELDNILLLQARENSVRTRMIVLDAEINNLIAADRRDYLLTASPPMYSTEYFSQFRTIMWQTVVENMRSLSLPGQRYVIQHAWTFIAQFLLFLAVIFSIHRNREVLRASERWNFLAARPFATGFFVVILTQLLFPEDSHTPISLRLLSGVIGGISFVRILMIIIDIRDNELQIIPGNQERRD